MASHTKILEQKLLGVNFAGSIQVDGNQIEFNSYGTAITIEVDEDNQSHEFIGLSDATLRQKINGVLK
jgi:hypothetical protein